MVSELAKFDTSAAIAEKIQSLHLSNCFLLFPHRYYAENNPQYTSRRRLSMSKSFMGENLTQDLSRCCIHVASVLRTPRVLLSSKHIVGF